jgi:hypothetical protein
MASGSRWFSRRHHRRYDKEGFQALRSSSMAEKTFDLRGLKCPLPVLRTRKALAAGRRPAGRQNHDIPDSQNITLRT